jgi:flagellar assembly factor FliW
MSGEPDFPGPTIKEPEMPKFQTVRFGMLNYLEEDVVHLPEGVVGMPDLKRWLVLDMGDEMPMKWFQSLDRGDFGFPVSQPAFFADTYDIDIPDPVHEALSGGNEDWLAIFIISTVHSGGARITGNLLAPLVINVNSRRGLQMVLNDADLNVQQEMNYLKFGLAVDAQSAENSQESIVEETPEPAGV